MADEKGGARKGRRRAQKVVGKKKEFSFRGYSLEEIQAMPREEFLGLLTARSRRSLRRGVPDEHVKLLKELAAGRSVKTHRRELVVLPEMVGKKLEVHSGRGWSIIEVMPEMVGHFLGEFVLTRTFSKHAGPGVGATRSSKFLPLK